MPAYPNYGVLDSSSVTVAQNIVADRASNGAYHARILGAEKRTWKIRHMLTRTELASLKAFAAANSQQAVDFVWPPVVGEACGAYIVPGSLQEVRWMGACRFVEVELTLEEA